MTPVWLIPICAAAPVLVLWELMRAPLVPPELVEDA
jgi:hypothetical protein